MISPTTITLEGHNVRLEPLSQSHEAALRGAAADGKLWEVWYTAVPAPELTPKYISDALTGQKVGHMLPWAVRELTTDTIVGSTRYHDIVAPIDRVEIGYTWYATRWQRSHVNTACKLLLLGHAFDTLGCEVVGLRTDNFNFRSQQAIAALGAKFNGRIRHHQARRDGTVRDSMMYSILKAEWSDVKRHLLLRLETGTTDDESVVPFYRFEIDSPLDVSSVAGRLRAVTREPANTWRSAVSAWGGHPVDKSLVVGLVDDAGFQFVRRIQYGNAFLPQVRGTIVPVAHGSRVLVQCFLHPVTATFLILWFGILAASFLGNSASEPGGDANGAGLTVMLLLGALLVAIGFYPEARIMRRLLEKAILGPAP